MKRNLMISNVFLMVCLLAGCASFKRGVYDLMISSDRSWSGLTLSSVNVNGQTMSYLERPGKGDIIVLIHGFSGRKDNWNRFIRYIPKEYRVIAFDLPGHGDSDKPSDQTYSIDYMSSKLDQAVNSLGITKFHLAGHAMGGWITLFYTIRYPQKVISLCLVDTAGLSAVAPQQSDLQKVMLKGENPLIPTSRDEYDEFLKYVFYKEPFMPWPIISVLSDEAITSCDFNMKIWKEFHTQSTDIYPLLAELNASVLVIWGDKDRMHHVSTTEVLKKSLPKSEIVLMKDCGGLPIMERPQETAETYVSFLNRHKN